MSRSATMMSWSTSGTLADKAPTSKWLMYKRMMFNFSGDGNDEAFLDVGALASPVCSKSTEMSSGCSMLFKHRPLESVKCLFWM